VQADPLVGQTDRTRKREVQATEGQNFIEKNPILPTVQCCIDLIDDQAKFGWRTDVTGLVLINLAHNLTSLPRALFGR
jgi:hypothetical protein